MSGYSNILLRSVISFVGLIFITRLMGRKHRSELTFFDHVVSITIGSIIASIAVDRSINTIDGIIATAVWGILPILVGYISLKNLTFRKIVDSEPIIIIQNGAIVDKNMANSRYHIGDLLMQLRQKDVFDITEVEFAILEPNGDLSILKKPQYNTVTAKDLNIPTSYKGLMTELIINGQIMAPHLKMMNLDINWLFDQLKIRNIDNINDVIFAAIQTDGQIYIALKNKITY